MQENIVLFCKGKYWLSRVLFKKRTFLKEVGIHLCVCVVDVFVGIHICVCVCICVCISVCMCIIELAK